MGSPSAVHSRRGWPWLALGLELCIEDQAGEFVRLQAEAEQQAAPTVVEAMS
jgi:hypothetical protein